LISKVTTKSAYVTDRKLMHTKYVN